MIISLAPVRASGWGLDLAHWFIHQVPYVLIYIIKTVVELMHHDFDLH